ncbi:MAG: VCBS repeat-containing protein [Planctomycetes bacterium]|nr:VCBS repeat-containing protein [Planctomycetota bacterium]
MTVVAPAQQQFELSGKRHLPLDQTPAGFVAGDLDGDGDDDLVHLADGGILLNRGNGVFDALGAVPRARSWPPIDVPAGVACDVDGDGDLDLLLMTPGVSLLIQIQPLRFVDETSTRLPDLTGLRATTDAVAAAHGDVDGDGDEDLVLDFGMAGPPVALWNDGAGTFRFTQPLPSTARTTARSRIALVDFDGDGDLDVVRATATAGGAAPAADAGCVVFRNDGDRRLGSVVQLDAAACGFAVADVAGDARPDVVVCGCGGLFVWRNDGGFQFARLETEIVAASASPTHELLDVALESSSLVAHDLDHDGDEDLVLGTAVLRREPSAADEPIRFSHDERDSPGHAIRHEVVSCADFDANGHLDLLFSNGLLLLDRDKGRFVEANAAPFSDLRLTGCTIGDVIGNHDADGLRAGRLLEGDEHGRWRHAPFAWEGVPTEWSSFEDLDGDLDLDLVGFNGLSMLVLINDGRGGFTESSSTRLPSGIPGGNPLLTDVDGDGRIDIVSGNQAWVRNLGGGVFGPPTTISVGRIPDPFARLTPIDVEGDGDTDFIERSHILWLNQGPFGFIDDGPRRLPFGFSATTVDIVADLDGDGMDDFVAQNPLLGAIVALNNGSGTFLVQPGSFQPNPYQVWEPATDVNGDGIPDLTSPLGVFLNDGAAHFALDPTPRFRMPEGTPMFDLDRDGDVDAFYGGRVMHNMERQVTAPYLPRAGELYPIHVHSRDARFFRIAQVMVGFGERLTPIHRIGNLLIDPSPLVPLPLTFLPPDHTRTTLRLRVPAQIRSGFRFFVQAAIYDTGTGDVRLTNVLREQVF